ncbi:MAG: sodium:proton exchanger [Candidatus Niyogibacteria bacterium CG10_big_fil_rev_8_21_14_0_10_46_36]|uniref:Sodium:proton exchanger n=1 Tax=Candidatus Niyogibacteria bacterium CG10_big_fil_rev_8_21_14_0_10_46_36 TaxID=1974726 RepID=A0A2H0TCJ1_9BACT|nr:MAG: sodium:proton exchanger [Candidatus Niyogibacteria bacterium CG10_big_fil_rev_8_21_14_0_10_46_36]
MVYILFCIGLFLLVKGADWLVDGASALGKRSGIPPLVIGLTIVAFGTSMPELIVNIFAALGGNTEVAFGNIIGSNISNTLLILGIAAVIAPITIKYSTVWREIPLSFMAVLALFVLANDFLIDGIYPPQLTRGDGLILLLFFAIFLYYIFETVRSGRTRFSEKDIDIKQRSYGGMLLFMAGGVVGLYVGGNWTVDGAVFIAQQFGLSQFLISATIIALGTSLPELVTSVAAARKQEMDLAVGNIVGSNIFNIFWILGFTSLFAPITVPSFINADLVFLVAATLIFFSFMFVGKKHALTRKNGALFLVLYVLYIGFLIFRG